MKQIHVVGTGPRTGTTLLAEAIRACCNIDYATEHEDRLFARPPRPCEWYLSKHPGDLLVVSPSLFVDSGLYVVCLIRDPRDAIVSRHGSDPDRYWAGLRYWKAFYPLVRKYSGHRRFLTIRYEDFTKDPDETQRVLMDRVPGLEAVHPFSEYHRVARPSRASRQALRSLRPIEPQGIGNWRSHPARVKQQLEIHGDISRDLIESGYETDDSWLGTLADVAPYEGESHWPEHFSRSDIATRKRYRYTEALKRLLRRITLKSRSA